MGIYLGNHIRSYLLFNSPQSYGVIIDIYVLGKYSITGDISYTWDNAGNLVSQSNNGVIQPLILTTAITA